MNCHSHRCLEHLGCLDTDDGELQKVSLKHFSKLSVDISSMSTQYRVILIVKVKMLWLELVPNLPLLYLVGFGSSILVLVAKVACEI